MTIKQTYLIKYKIMYNIRQTTAMNKNTTVAAAAAAAVPSQRRVGPSRGAVGRASWGTAAAAAAAAAATVVSHS